MFAALVALALTLQETRGVDTPWPPPKFASRAEWEARAPGIRQRILFAAGLLPAPPKTSLNPQVFGRIERQGYTVEKVYFESLPGFFVTGNLYRPRGRPGPFPAVLSPHGHWTYGRLENTELASAPGRAINLARQGYVVFTYDMVGYNDSRQVPHDYAPPRAQLWSFNVLGLQLWNSIRALDFLETLPDVDRTRFAATGASGGGTQTFLVAAVDDRVKVAAPVNMVSLHMQGGSNCENAPGLRLGHSNVEVAASLAPRPLLLVAATGDWTRDTPRLEFPAIRDIYKLMGAEDRVHSVQFHALHNYNRDSREAVYAWFAKWLLRSPEAPKEQGFRVEPPGDLLVWYDRPMPRNQVTADSLLDYWTKLPSDPAALRLALAADLARTSPEQYDVKAPRGAPKGAVILFGGGPAEEILRAGRAVLTVEPFAESRDTKARHFTTYNLTADQIRVHQIVDAAVWLKPKYGEVDVVGGLHALLARAVAPPGTFRRVIADAGEFNSEDDNAWLERLFIPGIRRAGGFAGVPREGVIVHHAGSAFRFPGAAPAKLADAEIVTKLR